MKFTLMSLPYAMDALTPCISEETLEYHYGKHHQAYVNKLNQLIENNEFENISLVEIIKTSTGGIFNNAAQIWNHDFYWQTIASGSASEPDSALAEMIQKQFGSLEAFNKAFKEHALSNFGSGWTWLVKKSDNTLAIVNTSNANNPLVDNQKPLLVCDVWEHAYYIDYRNDRAKYLDAFLEIINWNFVKQNYEAVVLD